MSCPGETLGLKLGSQRLVVFFESLRDGIERGQGHVSGLFAHTLRGVLERTAQGFEVFFELFPLLLEPAEFVFRIHLREVKLELHFVSMLLDLADDFLNGILIVAHVVGLVLIVCSSVSELVLDQGARGAGLPSPLINLPHD